MTVKKFGESQPIRQSFSANVHDEAHDHTICVTERTRMLNIYVARRSYKVPYEVPYEIKHQLLNDDLYAFVNATLSG